VQKKEDRNGMAQNENYCRARLSLWNRSNSPLLNIQLPIFTPKHKEVISKPTSYIGQPKGFISLQQRENSERCCWAAKETGASGIL
jgi:hypothetical protein